LHLVGDKETAVFLHDFENDLEIFLGSVMKPPTPWIGSAIKAAMFPLVPV